MWLHFSLVVGVLVLRLVWVVRSHNKRPILGQPRVGSKVKVLVVLGSGGHTTEILRLLKPVISAKGKFFHLVFVVANTDHTSIPRVASILGENIEYACCRMPRIRHVGESLLMALLRLPVTLISALSIVREQRPDVLITNGPGTCLPIVFASVILELVFMGPRTVRVFVESFCRVTSISITGKLIYRFVDSFILQWKPSLEMASEYPRAKYLGVLI